jgi:hypothetical protein
VVAQLENAPSKPTKAVNGGLLLDNLFAGNDVNIEKSRHRSGTSAAGPYIGTGCLVAMKDPDSGWVNYGT